MISSGMEPQEGQIFFNGEGINSLHTHHLTRLGIGRTYQNIELFPGMTVLSNMLLARHVHCKYSVGSASIFSKSVREEEVRHRKILEELIDFLKDDLVGLASPMDLEYVWNFEGHESVMAKAEEMILQAQDRIYLALVPATFPELQPVLEEAVGRGVRVVIYTTGELDLPGARVVVAHVSEETLGQARGLGLILAIDGEEVLIGEWLAATHARASWTNSPFLVFLAEHHLRTDLYLPQLLACLGDEALELIQEEDRALFTQALESRVEC